MKLADRLLAPVDTDQVSLTNASIVHSFWMVILELVSKTEYEMWSNEATEISEISSLIPSSYCLWRMFESEFSCIRISPQRLHLFVLQEMEAAEEF